jgi:hypothetical protein
VPAARGDESGPGQRFHSPSLAERERKHRKGFCVRMLACLVRGSSLSSSLSGTAT